VLADLLRGPPSALLANLVSSLDLFKILLFLNRERLNALDGLVEFPAELCEFPVLLFDALVHRLELGSCIFQVLRVAVCELLRDGFEVLMLQLKCLEALDHVGQNRRQKLLLLRQ
jgi:hypothetical protein